ncbi:MAG: TAT-variant-translocated molybdopterin oxidoreductase [Oligoflexia bacterium]|nr:TAT-variant-translocated molybdopterin oxidoreductase [Oligoflexia bacterium]
MKKYWASLEELNNDPKFVEQAEKEFLSSPLVEEGDFGRRDFMKLMAATGALASTACFQKPMHKIMPYVNQPEEVTFGVANYYASTCGECAASCGTLVKTREGRPIKLEGNPDHPMNKGGLCSKGQASLLGLYDPDRLRSALKTQKRGEAPSVKVSWEDVDKEILVKLKKSKSARILTKTINSPSLLKLLKEFGSKFEAKHVVYDAVNAENIIEAQYLSYGQKVLPQYRFDKAETIVSIDADFLGTWISPVEFTKQFSKTRKLSAKKKNMSELFVFESMMTVTGANADVRGGIKPSQAVYVAMAIANELQKKGLNAGANSETYKKYSLADEALNKKIKSAAASLYNAQGKSLVVGGNDLALQIVVNQINSMLKNDGVTVDYSVSKSHQLQGSSKEMLELVKEMAQGKVDTLIIYKANPAYTLPKSAGFEEALKKVENVIYVGTSLNETAVLSEYALGDHHSLEAWGDAEPKENLFSLQQPTIRPLFETRSLAETLMIWLGKEDDWHSYIQKYWNENIYKRHSLKSSFTQFWETSLRDGVFEAVRNRAQETSSGRTFRASVANYISNKAHQGMEVSFYETLALGDGELANNPWLQEVPDPITRITWDNYASFSTNTAKKLGIQNGDIVKIKIKDQVLEIPGHVQPGLHDDTIAVALGYGRSYGGSVGTGIGKNAFMYAQFNNNNVSYLGFVDEVKKTGEKYILASPQMAQSLLGRPIVKEATLSQWQKDPASGNKEHHNLITLWTPHKYEGYRWAMAIDLNSCTGCNACVVACQSENNIPVVGKDAVNRSRIMHWIRIDRYYTGTPEDPQVVHQPMLCQHCENAPCETVCPVIATMHSDEGLNSQIYNRCVGTRYCANNCPYKVRRFNWFDYNYGGQNKYPKTLAQNPEVTVRSRGVMEKCTFCVQRIQDAKNTAKSLERPVKDGEVKTACQQSCPADAIVFGNINDADSEISKTVKNERGYHVLEELNVKPSVTYLTKIRNVEYNS